MAISKKMEEAFNAQINAEAFSAYLYLSMSAYFEDANLPGFASWMKAQAQEEVFHAMKMYSFVVERGGRVTLAAIDAPETKWESTTAVFEATLTHEEHVTSLINKLVILAREENDQAAEVFLHWFVNEQVEEEATADEWLQKVKMVETNPGAMYFVDREAATRIFTPPAAE